jgi:hypothetical protein
VNVPLLAEAVSVTCTPKPNVALQAPLGLPAVIAQSIPPGSDVTLPEPLPAPVTLTVRPGALNVAVTLRA